MASNKKIAAGLIAAATFISTPAVGMITAGTAMADSTTAATITVNGDVAGRLPGLPSGIGRRVGV